MKDRGITLVELIMVVSIISILGTISTVIVGNTIRNNRDQTRLRDLNTIKQALELYRFDQHYYPPVPPSFPFGAALQNPAVTKTYLDPVPNDTSAEWQYSYVSLPVGCSATATNCSRFVLCAKKEGNQAPARPADCDKGNCAGSVGDCDTGIESN